MHFSSVTKGDKTHYVVSQISEDLPNLENIAASHAESKKSSVRKSRQASMSPEKKLPKELQAKIEEHDEEAEGRLGKRASISRAQKKDELNQEDAELHKKINAFLERLKSDDRKDVEMNAKMLARFVQHFACNFSADVSEIMKAMDQQHGDINIDKVRAAFVRSLNS